MGEYFMTRPEFDKIDNSRVCREYTHPRDHPAGCPKGSNAVNTRFGPALDAVVTKKRDMYGVEIKIDSMKRAGSESRVVICRGIERHVTELTVILGKPGAWTLRTIASTSSSSRIVVCALINTLSALGGTKQR